MAIFGRADQTPPSAEAVAYFRSLVDAMTVEVIPLKSIDSALAALPPNSSVSVTASPVRGLEETIILSDRIRREGHRPIPHISARLIEGPEHVDRLARWLHDEGHDTIFVVAGDPDEAVGPYDNTHAFLVELFDREHGLSTIGVAAYPDGHALIPSDVLHEHLHLKQSLLAEAGLASWASTQMCFDTDLITAWIREERAAGLTMPIQLGIPGVVDRSKLMTMGIRLGVGASLRFLKKNRSAVVQMFAPGAYDPNDLLEPMIPDFADLGIVGLHVFTFNQIQATREWQESVLATPHGQETT